MRWLLLDLAGVLADFDSPGRVERLGRRAGLDPAVVSERLYDPASGFGDAGFVAAADAGRRTAAQVLEGLRERLDWPGSDVELAAAWASAFAPAPGVLAVVARLRAARPGVRTGLLTNNDALLARVLPAALPGVWAQLDAGAFFAGELGVAKPDPGAWAAVLDTWSAATGADVAPADVVFADDSAGHVAAARDIGLTAVQVTGAARLERDLAQLFPG